MRNLTGYSRMRRYRSVSLLIIFILTLFIFFPIEAFGQEKVTEDITSTGSVGYTIEKDGSLKGRVLITLTNNSNESTAVRYFKTSIPFESTNSLNVSYSGIYLESSPVSEDGRTRLQIDLQNRVLRPSQSMDIIIDIAVADYFDDSTPLLSIPTRYDIDSTKTTTLVLPEILGEQIEVQPEDHDLRELSGGTIYEFDELNGQDISIILKDELIYSYKQTNKLENNDTIPVIFDVLIPPSNNSQRLILNRVVPEPDSVQIDGENNILLKYSLEPKEVIEVSIVGYIKRKLIHENDTNVKDNPQYLERSDYWAIEESDLKQVEKVLGDIEKNRWDSIEASRRRSLIKGISTLVVQRLEPSEQEQERLITRIGASSLIKGYNDATSRDYVDLSIALLRAYGIPSRQVIGYSTNIHNLFSDSSTHTWLEYWEPEMGWVSLDTYQDEIFNTNRATTPDADTIVLMYRGLDSAYPVYTSYSLKELEVELADATVTPITQVDVGSAVGSWSIDDQRIEVPFTLKNSGSTIITGFRIVDSDKRILFESDIPIVPDQTYVNQLILSSSILPDRFKEGEFVLGVDATSSTEDSVSSEMTVKVSFEESWWWKPLITTISISGFLIIVLLLFELLNISGDKRITKKTKIDGKQKQKKSNKQSKK